MGPALPAGHQAPQSRTIRAKARIVERGAVPQVLENCLGQCPVGSAARGRTAGEDSESRRSGVVRDLDRQPGLADPGLPDEEHPTAGTFSRRRKQMVGDSDLWLASDERHPHGDPVRRVGRRERGQRRRWRRLAGAILDRYACIVWPPFSAVDGSAHATRVGRPRRWRGS